jgi:sulfonate transport system permease protein
MMRADTELGSFRVQRESRVERSPLPAARRSWLVPQRGWGLLVPLLVFAAWWLTAARGWVAPQILPPPARVGQTLVEQLASGELLRHLAISLTRVAAGFLTGSALGVALGTAMGLSRRAEDYLYPSFRAVSQVPVLGFLPLAMMWLGIGETLKVAIIAQACLIPVALNVLSGIQSVPVAYMEVARVFGFSRWQLLARVIFPATTPALFVGLRGGLTQAWLSLVTVELLASSEGLGFLIVWGRQLFQLDLVLSAIIAVGLVGLLLDRALARVEARLLRWRPTVQLAESSSEPAP